MNTPTTTAETLLSSLPKPRKRLFLDIDGVLNTPVTTERCGRWMGVDRGLASRFADWCRKQSDLEVILSSTWRTDKSMWPHLNEADIHFTGITKDVGSRPAEIADYMADHPGATHYAILDDQDYGWFPYQRPFFVQTSEDFGLTLDTIKALNKVLCYD